MSAWDTVLDLGGAAVDAALECAEVSVPLGMAANGAYHAYEGVEALSEGNNKEALEQEVSVATSILPPGMAPPDLAEQAGTPPTATTTSPST